MASTVSDRCVFCKTQCRERQQALQCDVCSRWQHRKCRTGISQTFYRRMNKGLETLDDWRCYVCSLTSAVDAVPDSSNSARGILEETSSTSSSASPSDSDQSPEKPTTVKSEHSTGSDVDLEQVVRFGLRFQALSVSPEDCFSTPVRKLFPDSSESSSEGRPRTETERTIPRTCLDDSSSEEEWMSPPRVDVATPLHIKLEQLHIGGDPSVEEYGKRHEDLPTGTGVYRLIEGGSGKGKPLLVESNNYSYSKKRVTPNYTYWGCTVRGKEFSCPARVKQVGTTFTALNTTHSHPNKPGIYYKTVLTVQCKKAALAEPSRSVPSIVKEMYNKPEYKAAILPPFSYTVRRINRYRQINQL